MYLQYTESAELGHTHLSYEKSTTRSSPYHDSVHYYLFLPVIVTLKSRTGLNGIYFCVIEHLVVITYGGHSRLFYLPILLPNFSFEQAVVNLIDSVLLLDESITVRRGR